MTNLKFIILSFARLSLSRNPYLSEIFVLSWNFMLLTEHEIAISCVFNGCLLLIIYERIETVKVLNNFKYRAVIEI